MPSAFTMPCLNALAAKIRKHHVRGIGLLPAISFRAISSCVNIWTRETRIQRTHAPRPRTDRSPSRRASGTWPWSPGLPSIHRAKRARHQFLQSQPSGCDHVQHGGEAVRGSMPWVPDDLQLLGDHSAHRPSVRRRPYRSELSIRPALYIAAPGCAQPQNSITASLLAAKRIDGDVRAAVRCIQNGARHVVGSARVDPARRRRGRAANSSASGRTSTAITRAPTARAIITSRKADPPPHPMHRDPLSGLDAPLLDHGPERRGKPAAQPRRRHEIHFVCRRTRLTSPVRWRRTRRTIPGRKAGWNWWSQT